MASFTIDDTKALPVDDAGSFVREDGSSRVVCHATITFDDATTTRPATTRPLELQFDVPKGGSALAIVAAEVKALVKAREEATLSAARAVAEAPELDVAPGESFEV